MPESEAKKQFLKKIKEEKIQFGDRIMLKDLLGHRYEGTYESFINNTGQVDIRPDPILIIFENIDIDSVEKVPKKR